MSEFINCNLRSKMCDENGSMTWTISVKKISFLFCFNNQDIDLEQILGMLNVIAVNCCLYLLASNSQMREAGIMTLQSGLNLFVKNSLIN